MAETQAGIGYGTLFEYSLNNGGTWASLAEVTNITPPSDTVDVLDATHMQSPNRTREFIEGLVDPGEASFEMNFIPGSPADVAIRGFRGSGRISCRITWVNGTIWTFKGIMTSYAPAVPTEAKMTATVTFKVTGSLVSTPLAAPVNSVLPAISGIAQVGEVLTAWEGVWSGSPEFTYQWNADGVAIGGATSVTYTPVVGDIGDPITVTVTATNLVDDTSATSAATLDVIAAA
ncbi:MAG TPA: phage tail tube protein [Devosia sp.]|jgi:hypothetical protein|nr:phage tail tube protein [Devosia sp.]